MPNVRPRRKVYVSTERGEIPLILDTDRVLWKGCKIDGKRVNTWVDPSYKARKNMFERAYKMDKTRPGYKDVSVCDEWFVFTNFDKWFNDNYIEGFVLDKDLVKQGNKVYCPEFCRFIPQKINTILSVSSRSKRQSLLGVHIRKSDARISAKRSGSRGSHLGYFSTVEDAHFAWLYDKYKSINAAAEEYRNDTRYLKDVYTALIKRAEELKHHYDTRTVYLNKEE